jgi:acyl-CoA synthetase (AMP-forming)/AMP-acid ligase II
VSAGHPAGQPRTLVELLETRAQTGLGRYTFLNSNGDPEFVLDYPALSDAAERLAAILQQTCEVGSRVVLLYPTGPEFLKALFGCFFAGMVAVPLPMPEYATLKRTVARLQTVAQDADPSVILCHASAYKLLKPHLNFEIPETPWIDSTAVLAEAAGDRFTLHPEPGTLAYLQYTSGSTGSPRGVMVTYANVMKNLGYLRDAFHYDQDSISVTWMPHFHDFGLVEGLLHPLYSDIPSYLMAPMTMLKRPLRWLQAIDTYRATHSHGPNFAYESCIRRIDADQRAQLDLSSWKVAVNGAEPVRPNTMRRFSQAFAVSGFRQDTFYPGYGLAEVVLFSTVRRTEDGLLVRRLDSAALKEHRVQDGEPGEASREVVCCGVPQGEMKICVVDPVTARLVGPGRVGEIWISDPSVAAGYWRKPEDTRETFQAALANEEASTDTYLRTGDLGFLDDGKLYWTGRLKDLIISRGLNHYPQDIENTLQTSFEELRDNCCVAFSVEGTETDELIVAAELDRQSADHGELMDRMRQAVFTMHGILPSAVLLLERGAVFKTSSGKVQRSRCREAYLDGTLGCLASRTFVYATTNQTLHSPS